MRHRYFATSILLAITAATSMVAFGQCDQCPSPGSDECKCARRDVNHDGVIDGMDFGIMTDETMCDISCRTDLNGDGVNDLFDILDFIDVLISNPCGGQPIPFALGGGPVPSDYVLSGFGSISFTTALAGVGNRNAYSMFRWSAEIPGPMRVPVTSRTGHSDDLVPIEVLLNGVVIASGENRTEFDAVPRAVYEIRLHPAGPVRGCDGFPHDGASGLIDVGGPRWTGDADQRWNNPANWSTNTVPTSSQIAVFDLPGEQERSVLLEGDVTVRGLGLRRGSVHLMTTAAAAGSTLHFTDQPYLGSSDGTAAHITFSGLNIVGQYPDITIWRGTTVSVEPSAGFGGTIRCDGTLDVFGTLEGNGTVYCDVANSGTVFPRCLGTPTSQDDATLSIQGGFRMEPSQYSPPVFKVAAYESSPAMISKLRVDPPLASDPRVLLGGEIRVIDTPNLRDTSVGTRLACLEVSGPLSGIDEGSRFESQKGLRIQAEAFLFVNHDYQNKRKIDTSTSRNVELCVLQAPIKHSGSVRRFLTGPGAANLMLMTHGTSSFIPPSPNDGQFALMAYRASEFAESASVAPNWDIATLDWRDYSAQLNDLSWNPNESARIGRDIAESVVVWLREGGFNYLNYHLLGHSSGCWLVDELATSLVQSGQAENNQISLTAFDLYDGVPYMFGTNAGSKEQYVDMAYGWPPFTDDAALPGAVNIDVTGLRDRTWNVVRAHAWPYDWYNTTIPVLATGLPSDCHSDLAYYGFERSPLAQSVQRVASCGYDPSRLATGLVVLGRGRIHIPTIFLHVPLINAVAFVVSQTGDAHLNADGTLHMATGSPVWARATVNVAASSDFIRFKYRYLPQTGMHPAGELTAYVNGNAIFTSDEATEEGGLQRTGRIFLRDQIQSGSLQLEFHLDPLTSTQSVVEISEIELGLGVCAADFNADQVVDLFDYLDFLAAFAVQGSIADFNSDGVVDLFDYLDFVQAFAVGC